MLNLIISFIVSGLTTAGLHLLAGMKLSHSWMIGLAVFAVLYFILARIIMKKVGNLMESAQRDLQAGRTEKAVATLQEGFKYSNWQFYIKGQVNSQIGMVLFLKRDFAEAFNYLQKGFARHWVAMGMLGVCYMKRNKPAKMEETFEKAVAASKKEAFIWNLYAYCLEKTGQKEKAVSVLEKGLKKAGSDERLQASLDALNQGKRMKMEAYGDLWYQFHLEKAGTLIKKQTRAVQGRRKIVRR